jgi:site-specific DNA-methyltransferase (adenine-specific)
MNCITSNQNLSEKNLSLIGGLFNNAKVERTGGAWASKYGDHIKKWDIAPGPEYFNELFRVSKLQIIWGGNYFGLPPSRNFIVWRKRTISEDFTMAMAEFAWTNIPGNAKVFEYQPQDPNRFHPTQKPVALYKWLLSKYSKPGWKILDTHLGSGTHAIACYDMKLSLVACEIDEEYFDGAVDSLMQFSLQGTLDFGESK